MESRLRRLASRFRRGEPASATLRLELMDWEEIKYVFRCSFRVLEQFERLKSAGFPIPDDLDKAMADLLSGLERFASRGESVDELRERKQESITPGQRRAFFAKCGELDRLKRQERGSARGQALSEASREFGRDIESVRELSSEEASWLLDWLNAAANRAAVAG